MAEPDDSRIPLPNFLKLLTTNNVSVPKAMEVAGKVYKEYNTPSRLEQLSDIKLKALGLDDKDTRKLVMTALRKAGYANKRKALKPSSTSGDAAGVQPLDSAPSGSAATYVNTPVEILSTPSKRKRKRFEDDNEFLPQGPRDEAEGVRSLEFNEILDEEVLVTKSSVINRAPVMTAWAMVVAECMHFTREEALSIASVYTEMNALSKGVSLGIYTKDQERGREAEKGGSQPYVELMGRRVPLFRSQAGQWRALSNGSPVPPSTAFSYISRSFRQTTAHIIGSMKLLAQSYSPHQLGTQAWPLYAQFRPDVDAWGKRGEVNCKTILDLRKKDLEAVKEEPLSSKPVISNEYSGTLTFVDAPEPAKKRSKVLTLEEYETALDQDTTFDDIDLDLPADVGTT